MNWPTRNMRKVTRSEGRKTVFECHEGRKRSGRHQHFRAIVGRTVDQRRDRIRYHFAGGIRDEQVVQVDRKERLRISPPQTEIAPSRLSAASGQRSASHHGTTACGCSISIPATYATRSNSCRAHVVNSSNTRTAKHTVNALAPTSWTRQPACQLALHVLGRPRDSRARCFDAFASCPVILSAASKIFGPATLTQPRGRVRRQSVKARTHTPPG